MGAQGTTTVNFGTSLTGSLSTSVAITGQASILTGSLVEAWILPLPTADHSIDEHILDPPLVQAGSVVPGVGFTIYATAPNNPGENGAFADVVDTYGLWTVAWCWN